MEIQTIEQRQHYIDHLRGFMFIVMAIDHSLHAYADKFGKFWFFQDNDRTFVFDMFYVFDQSIIMPMIFFIIGMFVVPSLKRRGIISFIKERLIRIGVPFLIGVPFIVPILSYPKFEYNEIPNISYWDFWSDYFFSERLQGGPFWVMYAILLYTALLLTVYYMRPIYGGLVRFFAWVAGNPKMGFFIIGILSSIILGVSDWIWGAPWWIGFGKIFNLQASRIGLVIMYFFAGSCLVSAGIIKDDKKMDKLSDSWWIMGVLMSVLGIFYSIYCSRFCDIAYAFPADSDSLPGVLVRTTLHAFLCLSQVLFLLAIFRKFFFKPTKIWTSLATNAWGIFIIHESIVVWMQYMLNEKSVNLYIKFFLTMVIGISVAWVASDILRRMPGFKRVLGTQKYNASKFIK